MGKFRTSSATKTHWWKGQHRFEHWYRDNTVYFITSKVRNGYRAFQLDAAKLVFWDRFDFYTNKYGFEKWCETLLDNHYHFVGYLKNGSNLGPLMQKIHGSVAKLTNDLLPTRHLPFWRFAGNQDYFDGCLRDEQQVRRASRYTLTQAVRAGIVVDWRQYPHTRLHVDLNERIQFSLRVKAIPIPVPYRRYQRGSDNPKTR